MGEKTKMARYKAKTIGDIDYQGNPPDSFIEFMNELNENDLFLEGLNEIIICSGFKGDINDKSKVKKYIKQKLEEQEAYKRVTFERWIDGEVDDVNKIDRENIYRLCLSLGISINEVNDFFNLHFLQRPFNFRSREECVYYYCFANKKTYVTAKNILKIVENDDKIITDTNDILSTRYIGNNIDKIDNDNDLIEYIVQNPHDFTNKTTSGKEIIEKLLDEIYQKKVKIDLKRTEENEDKIRKEEKRIKRKKNRSSQLIVKSILQDIYIGLENSEYTEELNYKKKDNIISEMFLSKQAKLLPNETDICNIRRDKTDTSRMIRGAIILLTFFDYFNYLCEENEYNRENLADECIMNINQNLYDAGLPELYERNPFDWMFMYFAYREDPIETFQKMVGRKFVMIKNANEIN